MQARRPAACSECTANQLNMAFACRQGKAGKLLQSNLPKMRGLTFLRLAPEMMTPSYQKTWVDFMHRMQSIDSKSFEQS